MLKKKTVAFVPADNTHLEEFRKFENSLRKFHNEEDLPLLRFNNPSGDPRFWYRAKPVIARTLIQEYECVIGFDADQIVTGDLSHIWEGDYDVATVLNDPSYPIQLWDIQPYFNNGLVVLKSEAFINHWYRLCLSSHFEKYQFREQDLLNILCSDYHNYKVKCLDLGDKIHGEFAKPLWAKCELIGDKIMVGDKQLCMIHFGGGNIPNKGNYRIKFQPDVIKRIEQLIS